MRTTLLDGTRQARELDILPHMERLVTLGELDAFAAALNGCYTELSPQAKLYALEVAKQMARLRGKLVSKAHGIAR